METRGVGAFAEGFATFFRGLALIWKPRVRLWAFLPLVLNAALYACLLHALGLVFSDLVESTRSVLPEWLHWLDALLWLLFAVAAFFLLTFTFLIAASLLASPFNPILSRSVESLLLTRESRPGHPPQPGRPMKKSLRRERASERRPQPVGIPHEATDSHAVPPHRSRPSAAHSRSEALRRQPLGDGLAAVLLDLPRTVWQETRKLLYFLGWTVLLLLLFLVPGVNVAAPFLWAFFGAWMCTLDTCDHPMENHGIPFVEMRRRLRRHLPLTMGFGTAMMLFLAVPVLNLLALPAGVAGATVLYLEHLQNGAAP